MTNPLWGLLQKAQDDPQTIDEAIAAAIAAHEADPEAHLGSGESLEQHKTEGIIDHPMGSVLGDKFTNKEFVLQPNFESYGVYTTSYSDLRDDLGGFRIRTTASSGNRAYVTASGQYAPAYFQITRDITMQWVGSVTGAANHTAYMLAGGDNNVSEPPGVGFKIVNGAVYACETVWGSEDFEEYTTLISGVDGTSKHLYRIQVDTGANALYFFIDGEQVASWTPHASDDYGLKLFSFVVQTNQSAYAYLNIGGVYLSIEQ